MFKNIPIVRVEEYPIVWLENILLGCAKGMQIGVTCEHMKYKQNYYMDWEYEENV